MRSRCVRKALTQKLHRSGYGALTSYASSAQCEAGECQWSTENVAGDGQRCPLSLRVRWPCFEAVLGQPRDLFVEEFN